MTKYERHPAPEKLLRQITTEAVNLLALGTTDKPGDAALPETGAALIAKAWGLPQEGAALMGSAPPVHSSLFSAARSTDLDPFVEVQDVGQQQGQFMDLGPVLGVVQPDRRLEQRSARSGSAWKP